MWYFEINVLIQYLLVVVCTSTVLRICIALIKYVIWIRKITNYVPGSKIRFFNILGCMSCLPLTKKSRNGYSLLAHAHNAFLGVSKFFALEKLFYLWIFRMPVVVLAKAEAVQVVFSNSETIEKPWIYKWLGSFFGTGLINSGGNLWRSRRRFLNTCFRKNVLTNFLPVMNKHSRLLVETLEKEIEEDFTKISKPIRDYSRDTIYEIAFGTSDPDNSSNFKKCVDAIQRGFRLIAERMMNLLFWSDFVYSHSKKGKRLKEYVRTSKDFIKTMIRQEKQKHLHTEVTANGEKDRTALQLFFEHHLHRKDFTEDDLFDELITFVSGGQDTTGVALSWTMYLLGLYPDKQAKVHEELDSIFDDEPQREVTLQDINKMQYLKCCIKETLRLFPPISLFARQLQKDMNICGYFIPKGTICLVFPCILHHDETVFPVAERFDPDRFLPGKSQVHNSYAYVPFSGGPRNCIGQNLGMMNLMVVLSTLLRTYRWESLDQRDKVLPLLTIATAPSQPIRIRIRPRSPLDSITTKPSEST